MDCIHKRTRFTTKNDESCEQLRQCYTKLSGLFFNPGLAWERITDRSVSILSPDSTERVYKVCMTGYWISHHLSTLMCSYALGCRTYGARQNSTHTSDLSAAGVQCRIVGIYSSSTPVRDATLSTIRPHQKQFQPISTLAHIPCPYSWLLLSSRLSDT